MGKIVLGCLGQLDTKATLEDIKVAHTIGDEDITYVIEGTSENLATVKNDIRPVYIPVTLLPEIDQNRENLYVYFDLESYPFYQQAKELIKKEDKPKGVFRFRRMVSQHEDHLLLAGDIYVLSALLGEVESMQVKRTDQSVIPAHTIIMVNFGGGTMAHIEYTVSDQTQIELEWSGLSNIIEFDSAELRPVQPSNRTNLPLVYTVDALLDTAHRVDQEMIDQLDTLSQFISRGEEK